MKTTWTGLAAGVLAAGALWAGGTAAAPLPAGWQAHNMKPLAHLTLPGPRAFKLSIKQVKGRWYLYVAQGGQNPDLTHEGRGFNVVEVTDPANPKVLNTISLPNGGGQITQHDNLLIAGLQTPFDPGTVHPQEAPFGDAKPAVNDLAVLYDIADPVHPKQISTWRTDGWATHRNVYPGGKYAFMASWEVGYHGQAVLAVLDVSDPVHPKAIGHWWRPGQRDDEPLRAPPNGFHGPVSVSPDGKMLTMGYTPGLVNLDFTDPTHPKLIGELEFAPLPLIGAQAIHSGLPMKNGMVTVSIEPNLPGCTESLGWAAIVDNKDPAHPRLVSYYPRPSPPPGAPYKSFCDKGGRVGPHNVNAETHLPDAQAPGDLIFMTYFTAGIRAFDVTDPTTPKETGWFLPRIGTWESGQRGMEDVLVDTRGNIFVTDGRGQGLWVLRYTNPTGPKVPVLAK